MRKFLILFLIILFGYSLLPAVVSEYTFTSSVGTYIPITGGTVIGTAENDNQSFNAIPIGFGFQFDSTTSTDSIISINSNGYLVFGATAISSFFAISNGNANASNRVVVALNRDIRGKPTIGELMRKVIGEAPNRIFVLQWKNFQRYGTVNAADTLNFQIRLHETTNVIEIQYGHNKFGAANPTANTFQIGLRGNSNAEFNNRSVVLNTNDWLTSIPGTINTSSCAMSTTVVPPMGLSYIFTPPEVGDPPNPAAIVTPVNNGIDVLLNAHLIWADGGGGPTGYRIFLGTNNPPTNIVDSLDVGTILNYTPAANFIYSTTYYWKVVPYNQFGSTSECPIWSFTTLPDPAIVVFPYNEGFESAIFPPLGWTTTGLTITGLPTTGWISGTGTHTGTYCARSLYQPAGTKTLMTPRISIPASSRLRFWWKDADIAKVVLHDTTYCEISSNGGSTWNIVAILSASSVQTAYHQVAVDLTPYVGENSFIRWRDFSDGTNNSYGVGLDDVSIDIFVPTYTPPTNLTHIDGDHSATLSWDAAIVADGMTLSGYKIYRDGTLIHTTAPTAITYTDDTLTNNASYSFYVTALYENPSGESTPTNTITALPLAPVFDPPFNLSANQTAWNAITLNWLLPSDTESFEGTYPPADWSQTITNTGTAGVTGVLPTWCQVGIINVDPPIVPHIGNKQVGLWLAFEHQDEWLISPQFVCPTAANISFWSYCTQGSASGDHFYVKVSTNGGAQWTTLWDASTLPPLLNNYATPYTISLSAYAGQNIKLAWQAIDGPSMDGLFHVWFIDQIIARGSSKSISFNAEDFKVKSAIRSKTTVTKTKIADNNLIFSGNVLPVTQLRDRSLTGIKVYRNGTLLTTIANPTAHQYVDNTAVPGTLTYKISCYYSSPNGESAFSNEVPVTIAPYIFNPPTNFAAVPGFYSATLTWAAPTSGTPTSYKVYRNNTLVTTLASTVLTYTNTGLTSGTPYEFWVTASYTNPTGESAATPTITVTPIAPIFNPPTSFTAVAGNALATLTWAAPVSGTPTGYKVYRNVGVITTLAPTVLTYTNTGLINGLPYEYWVTATYTDPTGESDGTPHITVTPATPPLVPPTNLTGSIMTGNDIHLSWVAPVPSRNQISMRRSGTPNRSLLGYRVYQNNHPIQDVMSPTTTEYNIIDAVNSTYHYYVTALYTEAPGESAPSNTITVVSNQDPVMPSVTALKGNYPNPFNPTTVISYSVKQSGFVSLEIYNSLGKKVRTLVNSRMEAGNYTATWNGNDEKGNTLGSGLYFYKMKSGNYSSTKKMILLK